MDKRITPAECERFYRSTGMRPRQSTVYGCAIGACAKLHAVDLMDAYRWADSTFGFAYRMGFQRGFDAIVRWVFEQSPLASDPRHEQGYADGRACAAHVFAIKDWDAQSPVTLPQPPLLAKAVELALAK